MQLRIFYLYSPNPLYVILKGNQDYLASNYAFVLILEIFNFVLKETNASMDILNRNHKYLVLRSFVNLLL